jgi:hypothetical protein
MVEPIRRSVHSSPRPSAHAKPILEDKVGDQDGASARARGQMIYRRVCVADARPHIAGDTGEAPAVTDQGIGQGIYRRDAMARLQLWMPGSQQGTKE